MLKQNRHADANSNKGVLICLFAANWQDTLLIKPRSKENTKVAARNHGFSQVRKKGAINELTAYLLTNLWLLPTRALNPENAN